MADTDVAVLLDAVQDWAKAKQRYESADGGWDPAYFLSDERDAVNDAAERVSEALTAIIDRRVSEALASPRSPQGEQ